MTETGESYVSEFGKDESASEAVLRTIAAVSDRKLLDLPPIQESIDADALDNLFEASESVGSLQFEYAEYEITIGPEQIRVHERR